MTLKVAVIYSPAARQVREWRIEVAPHSTIAQAVLQSGMLTEFSDVTLDALSIGIWGERHGLHHKLQENDRIEIYRVLQVDPKTARRERFTRQGVKRAGLFATKRAGAKAGYGG